MATASATAATPHKPLYTHLYVQVLTAIVLGILLGHFYPDIGAAMKPLGDGFIKLIKMLIAPIIFCTVVHGIASMEDMKKVGRVGVKALVYPQSRKVGMHFTHVAPRGSGRLILDRRAQRWNGRSPARRPRPVGRGGRTGARDSWSGAG